MSVTERKTANVDPLTTHCTYTMQMFLSHKLHTLHTLQWTKDVEEHIHTVYVNIYIFIYLYCTLCTSQWTKDLEEQEIALVCFIRLNVCAHICERSLFLSYYCTHFTLHHSGPRTWRSWRSSRRRRHSSPPKSLAAQPNLLSLHLPLKSLAVVAKKLLLPRSLPHPRSLAVAVKLRMLSQLLPRSLAVAVKLRRLHPHLTAVKELSLCCLRHPRSLAVRLRLQPLLSRNIRM